MDYQDKERYTTLFGCHSNSIHSTFSSLAGGGRAVASRKLASNSGLVHAMARCSSKKAMSNAMKRDASAKVTTPSSSMSSAGSPEKAATKLPKKVRKRSGHKCAKRE